MTEGDSPTIARRRVRLAIREAREAAALTQQQVAEEMEWSLSKVIRIENGDVSIAPNDLRPLLAYLGIKDRDRVTAMLTDAKVARTRQRRAWWQHPDFRDQLTDALRRFIEYEAEAVAIRSYSIYYMPGLVQTPEYAAALTGTFHEEIPQERIRVLLEARKLRRESLLSRLGSVQYFMVLDESVFMRPTGGEEVFAAQLRDMHRLAEQGLLHIRMLPFALGSPIANNASYDLLSLGDDNAGNEVLYRENGLTDELVEEKASTSRHRNRFEKLWHLAASEADTIAFIAARISNLEKTIADRQGK
ncbi:MAG TPA: helix-turn-helix transcriptional regulator [Actinoplanes sp.]|jgi:transcriptional regulator with XRE-family HTH domain